MREEMDHAGWANSGGSRQPNGAAEPWSSFPMLVTVSVLCTLVLLVVGTGLARSEVGTTADAAGATEAPPAPPETDIGSAAVEVAGPGVPASTEDLTIVRIAANSCGARRTGTGVLIADGIILTAAHVVGDAGLVRVDAFGVTVSGEVLGVSADGRDLALVAVDAPVLEPVVAGPVHRLGEPLTLVGHPGGGDAVSVVGPSIDVEPSVAVAVPGDLVGVDASVEIGMSGGPALASDGTLVGIVVGTETATDTAIVVAVDDLASLGPGHMITGRCPTTA